MSFLSGQPTIAMITDYGEKDGFVGIMKGILYKTIQHCCPSLPTQQCMPSLVDVTHQVEPFNISQAAWVLNRCYQDFPESTIFIAVVDPGVGKASQKKLLLSWKDRKQFFIGPDNGIFTPIIQAAGSQLKAFSLTNETYFRQTPKAASSVEPQAEISQTFHGRDIYAPVAGHLAQALMTFMSEEFLLKVGERLDLSQLTQLDAPQPKVEKKTLVGHITHTDNFGNCTTNIPTAWLEELLGDISENSLAVELPSKKWIGRHLQSYAEGSGQEDVFVVPASTGTLELALYQRDAAVELNAKTGDRIVIRIA